MPVFKAFFKTIKVRFLSIVTYFIIFLIFGSMSANSSRTAMEEKFQEEKLSIYVVDEEESPLTKALIESLSKDEKVDVETGKKWTGQKEFQKKVNDNVRFFYSYALILSEGFSERHTYQFIMEHDGVGGYVINQKVDAFLKSYEIYLEAGMEEAEALQMTQRTLGEIGESQIEFTGENKQSGSRGSLYSFFSFLPYSLGMLMCIGIGLVLAELAGDCLSPRIQASAMSFLKNKMEIIGAMLVYGLATLLILLLIIFLQSLGDPDLWKAGYYILNSLFLLLFSLALSYFLSSLTKDNGIINMVSNMLTLGMSFTCGVFVPLEYLGDGVIKGAHFLPYYWYIRACEIVNQAKGSQIFSGDYLICLLILTLFAVVFLVAGMIAGKVKESHS